MAKFWLTYKKDALGWTWSNLNDLAQYVNFTSSVWSHYGGPFPRNISNGTISTVYMAYFNALKSGIIILMNWLYYQRT